MPALRQYRTAPRGRHPTGPVTRRPSGTRHAGFCLAQQAERSHPGKSLHRYWLRVILWPGNSVRPRPKSVYEKFQLLRNRTTSFFQSSDLHPAGIHSDLGSGPNRLDVSGREALERQQVAIDRISKLPITELECSGSLEPCRRKRASEERHSCKHCAYSSGSKPRHTTFPLRGLGRNSQLAPVHVPY